MPVYGETFGNYQLTINQTPPVNCYFEVALFPGYANIAKLTAIGAKNLAAIGQSVAGTNNASRYASDFLWTIMRNQMHNFQDEKLKAFRKTKDANGKHPSRSRARGFLNAGANILDFRFNKVSGFSAEMETQEIPNGGINNESLQQPMRIKRDNLVLERGIFTGSPLTVEFDIAMTFMQMIPSDILVVMQNPNKHIQAAWLYRNAFPVAWSNADLSSDDNDVAMEKMEFSYSHVFPIRQ